MELEKILMGHPRASKKNVTYSLSFRGSEDQIYKYRYSHHLSSRKLFILTHRDYYRNLQSIRLQSCGLHFYWIHLQNTPTSKAQGTSQQRGQKYCKSQRIRKFSVRLSLLLMPEAMLVTLTRIWTRTTADMQKWSRARSLILYKELQAMKKYQEWEK